MKYKITAYYVQYSYLTTTIEADTIDKAEELAEALTTSDFDKAEPKKDGDLQIELIEEIKD